MFTRFLSFLCSLLAFTWLCIGLVAFTNDNFTKAAAAVLIAILFTLWENQMDDRSDD